MPAALNACIGQYYNGLAVSIFGERMNNDLGAMLPEGVRQVQSKRA
jgi:hypothetical protein